ncbi:MAG: membrane protein insertase YidC [Rhodospirillaceae bacterium]|nr:membrane protein insertase YidC [Rhodospirillaceae bacterium]|tara:strand:- start:4238 stop:6049 length:1812 start_codon:yes stop_codon:yes gene_type:complete
MEQRNLILAAVLSVGILLLWQFLYEMPRMEQHRSELARQAELKKETLPNKLRPEAPNQTPTGPKGIPQPNTNVLPPTTQLAPIPGVAPSQDLMRRSEIQRSAAISRVKRLQIVGERIKGSISLNGGRIDDLILRGYRETVDPNSPEITLLSPIGAPKPYYAQFGWTALDKDISLPNDTTVWKTNRSTLTPQQPVTLTWNNGKGLVFKRVISIDKNYLFKITQLVENKTSKSITLYPYGLISRTDVPETLGFFILHEGLIGVFNGNLEELDYDDLEDTKVETRTSQGGWLGITDKYWLMALIPNQKEKFTGSFRHNLTGNRHKYQADFVGQGKIVPANSSASTTHQIFAGAKEVKLLDGYSEQHGIIRFDLAVDFGWFYFLTKPIFYVLEYFYRLLGNFGLGILLLTVLIKLAFFPLANKSYRAMSRMKQLQPKMMKLRERYPDNKQKLNESMMKLYREEKVNPAAGCLPIMIQIPVFFALYKVLFVTIEMRHAPFFGWIQDLSAADPTSMFNLFGLIPWNPPEILLIGIWPLLMGLTMWLQQKLNPAPADPIQQKIFMFLPIVFTFMLARFPAGLVIYWAWNNILSIAQQWYIMRRMGVKIGG